MSGSHHSNAPKARHVPARQPLKLSIVMPVHNEERTVTAAVREVLELDAPFDLELIVVDDGSTDATRLLLNQLEDDRLLIHRQAVNLGKGTAVLTGAALASGTHFVVFDADLEYVATDLLRMFEPIAAGRTDVVFGSRGFGQNTVYQSFRYAMGNRVTTLVANVLYDSAVSDMHTCLKMLPLPLLQELHLEERGFGLDSEITGELLRRGVRPFEVPVSYHSRSHAEGKKLTWRDGIGCLAVLGKVRFRPKVAPVTPSRTLARAAEVDSHIIDLREQRRIVELAADAKAAR